MILLCNDDGFNAEGLRVLRKELLTLDDVTIVAPETEQSAMGHAITLNQPPSERASFGRCIYQVHFTLVRARCVCHQKEPGPIFTFITAEIKKRFRCGEVEIK